MVEVSSCSGSLHDKGVEMKIIPRRILQQAFIPLGAYSLLQEEARQKAAAITIQSFWRAVRARHLATIQRALFKIRQMQDGASKGECALCVCINAILKVSYCGWPFLNRFHVHEKIRALPVSRLPSSRNRTRVCWTPIKRRVARRVHDSLELYCTFEIPQRGTFCCG